MAAITCPNCKATMPAEEAAAGWCEACGKKLPPFALRPTDGPLPARTTEGRSDDQAPPAPRPKASFGGFLVVMVFVVLGIGATVAVDRGKTDWIWLGGGIGAGTGVAVAQAAGLWPK